MAFSGHFLIAQVSKLKCYGPNCIAAGLPQRASLSGQSLLLATILYFKDREPATDTFSTSLEREVTPAF